jgi:crossover junction endodeoxyribonuclease RuvC
VKTVAKKKETKIESIVFPDQYKVWGADLSLKRPGFCLLSVNNGKIKVKKIFSIDNKNERKKCHGQLLEEIRDLFIRESFQIEPNTFFVREAGILHQGTPAEKNLSKVEGLMDWIIWKLAGKEWYTIYPSTVKKLIAGSGNAEKDEVAAALEKYVGKQEYKYDDESDAVAVVIAWLIQQGQIKEDNNG